MMKILVALVVAAAGVAVYVLGTTALVAVCGVAVGMVISEAMDYIARGRATDEIERVNVRSAK